VASLAGIAPGAVGRRVAGVAGGIATASPRTGLGAFVIASPKAGAVPIESRDGAPVVMARRVGAGRVMQVGYDETWRWRLGGGDEAAAAHREWWSRVVSAVAYAPIVPRSPLPTTLDETPLAALVSALGPATPMDMRATSPSNPARLTNILFAIAVVSLLLEWASRRLRGAR
jgi:hypothetical protein